MKQLTEKDLSSISQSVRAGFRIFINLKTNEVKEILYSEDFILEYGDFTDEGDDDDDDVVNKSLRQEKEFVENAGEEWFEIEKMSSREEFKVMEAFALQLSDNPSLRIKLLEALERPKPFRNFKDTIDGSGEYRDQWFKFQDMKHLEWVKAQLP